MPPVGFEPTISVGERPQTYTLDHAASGTGHLFTNTNQPYNYSHNQKTDLLGAGQGSHSLVY